MKKYERLKSVFLNSPALTEDEKAQCILDIDTCDPKNAFMENGRWTEEELVCPVTMCGCFIRWDQMPSGFDFWSDINLKLVRDWK